MTMVLIILRKFSFTVRFLLMTKYPLTIKKSNTLVLEKATIGSKIHHTFVPKKSGRSVKLKTVYYTEKNRKLTSMNTILRSSRIISVDIIRLLAILLVVVLHTVLSFTLRPDFSRT